MSILTILIIALPIISVILNGVAKEERKKNGNPQRADWFNNFGCLFAIVWMFFLAYGVYNFFSDDSKADSQDIDYSTMDVNQKWSENAKTVSTERVEKWLSLDVLEVDVEAEKAYIDPLFWNSVDYKNKEEIISTICIYIELQKQTSIASFDLYDKRSGKKIADWTKLSGVDLDVD